MRRRRSRRHGHPGLLGYATDGWTAPKFHDDSDILAHRLAETKNRVAELQALELELEGLYVRLLRVPGPDCGHLGDCACWLPTEEEVKSMTQDVACCGELCCPDCSCSKGGPCDCPDCRCNTAMAVASKMRGPVVLAQSVKAKRTRELSAATRIL